MNPIASVEGVVFDWGGTLSEWIYPGTVEDLLKTWREELHPFLVDAGHQISLEDLENHGFLIDQNYRQLRDHANIEIPQKILNSFILHSVGIFDPPLVAKANEIMWGLGKKYMQLDAQAPEILKELKKRGLKIGLLSNAVTSHTIREIITEEGITNYFDAIVISADLYIRKPNPNIFQFIANRLGLKPTKIIMVGNELVADIQGALAIGMHPVYINKNLATIDKQYKNLQFREINRLIDLLSLLKNLE